MANKTITHEIKLQKIVIVFLGILSVGVFLNVFAETVGVNKAFAELSYGDKLKIHHSGHISCSGCN